MAEDAAAANGRGDDDWSPDEKRLMRGEVRPRSPYLKVSVGTPRRLGVRAPCQPGAQRIRGCVVDFVS